MLIIPALHKSALNYRYKLLGANPSFHYNHSINPTVIAIDIFRLKLNHTSPWNTSSSSLFSPLLDNKVANLSTRAHYSDSPRSLHYDDDDHPASASVRLTASVMSKTLVYTTVDWNCNKTGLVVVPCPQELEHHGPVFISFFFCFSTCGYLDCPTTAAALMRPGGCGLSTLKSCFQVIQSRGFIFFFGGNPI